MLAAFSLLFAACSDSPTENVEPFVNPQPKPEEPATISLILGEVKATTVSLEYTTTNASEGAILCIPANQSEPTETQIMEMGKAMVIAQEAQTMLFENLNSESDYRIYAIAKNSEGSFCPKRTLEFTTKELVPDTPGFPEATHITLGDVTKTSFSYTITPDQEDGHYMHAYLEGWLFEYLFAQRYMVEGEEFDMDIFLKQCVIDYGVMTTGSQEFTWAAGEPHELRTPYFSTIVGGKEYYVLYSACNSEGTDFPGLAEAVTLTTEPAGESTSSLGLIIEELHPQGVQIRMEANRSVNFFFYDLYPTEQVETHKQENGVEGMMDYLYEYGLAVANSYTDNWGLAPSKSYTLCVLGVDVSGDLFYQELLVETPELIPHVEVVLRPYERELIGFHAYDTFELTVYPWNFYDQAIDPSEVNYLFAPASEVEAALGTLTLDELVANPSQENLALLNGLLKPLTESWEDMILDYNYISDLIVDLEADAEYCYLAVIPWKERMIVGYDIESTEPIFGGDEPTEAYKAFLGEWQVVGESSEDYYTPMSLNIRFEQLVSNRSYKVYGWSSSEIGEDFPFEARFNPETGKISIESIQQLGIASIDGVDFTVLFTGMTSIGGIMNPHGGFSGVIYEGRCDGTHLSMFPGSFYYGGYEYAFETMAYSAYYGGEFYAFDGDMYPIVNFRIDRPTRSQALQAEKSCSSIGQSRKPFQQTALLRATRK